jgi:hypothetical protein
MTAEYLPDQLPLDLIHRPSNPGPNRKRDFPSFRFGRGESALEGFHPVLEHMSNSGMRENLTDAYYPDVFDGQKRPKDCWQNSRRKGIARSEGRTSSHSVFTISEKCQLNFDWSRRFFAKGLWAVGAIRIVSQQSGDRRETRHRRSCIS